MSLLLIWPCYRPCLPLPFPPIFIGSSPPECGDPLVFGTRAFPRYSQYVMMNSSRERARVVSVARCNYTYSQMSSDISVSSEVSPTACVTTTRCILRDCVYVLPCVGPISYAVGANSHNHDHLMMMSRRRSCHHTVREGRQRGEELRIDLGGRGPVQLPDCEASRLRANFHAARTFGCAPSAWRAFKAAAKADG